MKNRWHGFGTEERFRIAVLMGGISSEREISLRSGTAIAAALRSRGHAVVPIDVTSAELGNHLDPSSVDVAFIALHGRFGEDGQVQQQCEALGLPYTGCGPKASALALDKICSKERFVSRGVSTPPFEVLEKWDESTPSTLVRLGLPVVVKPALEGSSIGLTIVREKNDLAGAVAVALEYGTRVLVETFVEGKELTVGILGDTLLPVIQIVPKSGVYDYHSKYTPGETSYLVPAPLDAGTADKVQAAAWQAFLSAGCEDLGRVDVILDRCGKVFVLEINTIPGFTETSLLPKAAKAAGIGFDVLCEKIMMLGLQKVMAETR